MFNQQKFLSLKFVRSLMLALSAVGVLSFVVLGVTHRRPDISATRTNAESQTTPSQGNEAEAKALLFVVETNGFNPTEIDVEEGRYLLVVQNRSGLSDIVVKLEREDKGMVHEEHAQQQKWRKRFDLKQGSYRLTVKNFPEWSCVIRVK